MKSIVSRLERLEKQCGGTLPVVNVVYEDGTQAVFYGLPPIEHITRSDNPIIQASGSEFADLVDAIIHPLPNRNIDDLEKGVNK